jgi:hypothetical protein
MKQRNRFELPALAVPFLKGKMVFAKLIFFRQNFFAQKDFSFPKYQKKFWREKN